MNGSDNITPSRPWSITLPSLAFSSLPPLSPSPSSSRRNSLPLMNPSTSMESRDSSMRFKKNSLLPPLGVKKIAPKDIGPLKRHYMSVSMDSCLSDLLKLTPSPGNTPSSRSVNGDQNASRLEFDANDYIDDELNKIAKSNKLKEVASDPKEVRRILKNRESAARLKQKKLQYMIDLEHRINFVENENASIFEKIKLLENDKTMMMNEKKEIMIRIESMEIQAQLRDALTEHLHAESERLKAALISNEKGNGKVQKLGVATCEVVQNRHEFDKSNMQVMDSNMINWSQPNPGFNGRI
ncbi:putative transcription factor bZIP family [Arabidopsis thaliana]|uniref:UNE4 n=2 Tax=Arabidopsis TaxID=3701 RepID=A0A178VY47_ARATH|nr:Basic-leucine zipper domain [Arabidopsis thaliana x Arabidopsis arenosa]OAP10766.1 UNE4 [Arabidopsis thaliana]